MRRLEESSGNVLGWEVTGKVTEEEVRTISEEFKATVAEHGKGRALVRMRRVPRVGTRRRGRAGTRARPDPPDTPYGARRLGGGLQAHALRKRRRALRHRERQQPLR